MALDDETARAVDGLTDLMSKWRAQRPFSTHRCWGLVFHRKLHLREACSDTLFDALDHENGGERTDTVQG